MHVLLAITRRLVLRSVTTGAFVGLIAGTGVFVVAYAQVALDPGRFAGWSVDPGQSVIFAFGGAIIGVGLGLAGCLGSLLLLRVRAAVVEPHKMHYAATAGLGAGVATAGSSALVLDGMGTASWVPILVGSGLGAVAACSAALHTRRILTSSPSRTG